MERKKTFFFFFFLVVANQSTLVFEAFSNSKISRDVV